MLDEHAVHPQTHKLQRDITNTMQAQPNLRVALKWMTAGSGSMPAFVLVDLSFAAGGRLRADGFGAERPSGAVATLPAGAGLGRQRNLIAAIVSSTSDEVAACLLCRRRPGSLSTPKRPTCEKASADSRESSKSISGSILSTATCSSF